VFHITLPPLRERKQDIPKIVDSLLSLQRHGRSVDCVHPEVMERLVQYSWPGNVRELRNVLERAWILAGEGQILPSHLPEGLGRERPTASTSESAPGRIVLDLGTSLYEAEKALILGTFEFAQMNRRRTAEILGVSDKTIQTKLKQYRRGEEPESGTSGEEPRLLAGT
jgi:DNA-binding NtrC family response regulator